MKSFLALTAAAFLSAPAAEPPQWSADMPPVRFQRVGLVPVLFVPSSRVAQLCHTGDDPPPGTYIVACVREVQTDTGPVFITIMPDPCEVAEADYYALIQCHENAHFLAGWRHETQ